MTGDGWEMAVSSEEDNTNSILDTIYKSPPGQTGRGGIVKLQLISNSQVNSTQL